MKTKTRTRKQRIIRAIIIAAIIVVVGLIIVLLAGKWFTAQESVVRDVWEVNVGDLLGEDEERQLEIRQAAVESNLSVIQVVPSEVNEEGFT